ncbi:hypothetical protein KAI58_03325 [Candidatus Gracilibacteria bacterium]|nr:hypothetical protein [Candidatus Gracilibacteria bacterium]
MRKIPLKKFDDSNWLLSHYEKLHYQKNLYGGSFFSVLLLTFFFFVMPLPTSIQENILFWRLGMFAFFFVVVVGWYLKSSIFYKFCISLLHYQYEKGNFPRDLNYKLVNFSSVQIIFYLLLALILPVIYITFFEHLIDLDTFHFFFYGFCGICAFLFLLRIEQFYDQREKMEEIEILTEAFLSNDPLCILEEIGGMGLSLKKKKKIKGVVTTKSKKRKKN